MPKVGMEPIRRRQLIEATITSIHEYGFADATVSRISAAAGVSTGIVHHYFDGKAAAYRFFTSGGGATPIHGNSQERAARLLARTENLLIAKSPLAFSAKAL